MQIDNWSNKALASIKINIFAGCILYLSWLILGWIGQFFLLLRDYVYGMYKCYIGSCTTPLQGTAEMHLKYLEDF